MSLKLTSDDLYFVFYSGYLGPPDWLVLDEIAFCLNNNILLLDKKHLEFQKKEFHSLIEKIKSINGPGGTQSKGHMALKNLADSIMKREDLASRQENYFMGLHPDVISLDLCWIIECGTTDPSVIFWYLDNEKVKKVSILPYLFAEENKFVLYNFSRGKKFRKFQKLKKTKLKDVFSAIKNKENIRSINK